MKVEDLRNLGLDDETIKKVQALSGADVTAAKAGSQSQIDSLNSQITDLKGQVSQRETDITDIKAQLEKAGQSSTKLAEVQANLTSLQDKYDTETKAYQKKLDDQGYEFKVRERASGLKFSCNAAKTAFIQSLMSERLPVKDDSLIGFDDYVTKQKEADPGAFMPDEEEKKNNPSFVAPTGPNNNPNPPKNEFKFDFLGVRSHE